MRATPKSSATPVIRAGRCRGGTSTTPAADQFTAAMLRVMADGERVVLRDDRGRAAVALIPIGDLGHLKRRPLEATPVMWRGRRVAALVSLAELRRLEEAEDRFDAAEATRILSDPDMRSIPWERARRSLLAAPRGRTRARRRR